jgi:WD40 repeat protein
LAGPKREAAINSLAITGDGKTLASAGADGRLRLWDLHSEKELFTLDEFKGCIDSVAFSPDGKTLAAAVWDQKGSKVYGWSINELGFALAESLRK